MYDFVYLEKKCLYPTKKNSKVYLAPNEKGKYRSASSSKFILKIMFTATVARPRFNAEGGCTFDGKNFLIYLPRASEKLIKNMTNELLSERLLNPSIKKLQGRW